MTIFELKNAQRTISACKFTVYLFLLSVFIVPIYIASITDLDRYRSYISWGILILFMVLFFILIKISEALDKIVYNKIMKSLLKDINSINEPDAVIKEYYPLIENFRTYPTNNTKVFRLELNPPKLFWDRPGNYIEYICNDSDTWKITNSFEEPDENDD